MPRSTIRNVIDAEIEAAFESGIMACLIWHCKMDSAKAQKTVSEIKKRPNTLTDRKRQAGDRIVTSLLKVVTDVAGQLAQPKL